MKYKKIMDWFPLILLVWLMTCQTITARWFTYYFNVSPGIQRAVTLLTYLPFVLLAVCKFVTDVITRKFTPLNILFYGFCLYYLILTVCRFFLGMQIKENMYYTIILLGSFAYLSLLIQRKSTLSAKQLSMNLCVFTLFVLVYRLSYCLFFDTVVSHSPVNEIALGGMVLVLLPAVTVCLKKTENSRLWQSLCMVAMCGILLLVMTLSARSIFFIVLTEGAVLLLLFLRSRKFLLRMGISFGLAVVIMAVMLLANVPGVRYAFFRETGISLMEQSSVNVQVNEPGDMENAAEQIERSDTMRSALNKFSIEEFKKNPLFGTGELMFQYTASGYEFNVPAHNFVLATLNCYGLVGLFLILAMLCAALYQMKLFDWKDRPMQHTRLTLLLMVVCFFALGMVQATVYDIMVLPTMVTSMAVHGQDMILRKEEHNVDQ